MGDHVGDITPHAKFKTIAPSVGVTKRMSKLLFSHGFYFFLFVTPNFGCISRLNYIIDFYVV